jgi:hypothetical protein
MSGLSIIYPAFGLSETLILLVGDAFDGWRWHADTHDSAFFHRIVSGVGTVLGGRWIAS